jgi:hypothetical protein
MPNARRSAIALGEWKITFEERTGLLDCRHRPTSARVTGRLSFASPRNGDMPVILNRNTGPGQLAICDARGDVQMYLRLASTGRDLTLALVPRGRTASRGRLTVRGTATLGHHTFACRTGAPRELRVVQMASGPADSALNDSLFDTARDTALRFRAARVELHTGEESEDGKRTFAFVLEGQIEHPAAAEVAISAEQHFYRSRYVPWYRPLDKQRAPSAPTGWMSWNTYFDQAGEAENLVEARLGAKYLKPYGLRVWSIESWQDNSGSQPVSQFHNLTLRPYAEQFPHGMKWLARQIRRLGFVPGIWTVPFGTGDEQFYQRHRKWFLHHPGGRPMSNWCGRYVLDPSQPAVRRHMTESHRTMAAWGYDFFKIDGIFGGSRHYSAQFYEAPEVRAAFRRPCEDPLARTVQALRRGLGPDRLLLACAGHYTGPEVAVSDAARIGGDVVSPNQPPDWHSYVAQASMILSCLFVHGLVWYCDPDTLLVGTCSPLEQVRVAASAIALAGQVTFAGDKLAALPPDRMWLLQRCLPVCEVRPLDLYPINQLVPIWDLKISRPFAQWDVVSVFNFDPQAEATITVDIAELGLDAGKQYLVYDFWARKLLGRLSRRIPLALEPASNRLLAVHEDLGRPQWLSTDRHLTQGAVSLRDLAWDGSRLTLSGRSELVAGEQTRLVFSVPAGFRVRAAKAARAVTTRVENGGDGTVALLLGSRRARVATWHLQFAADTV